MEVSYSLKNIDDITRKIYDYLIDNKDFKLVLFEGKMGAGKTTIIKNLCEKFEVIDEVTSPTFAIINEYLTVKNTPIYHFDFYRIENLQEAMNIGIEDYFFGNNYCFVEWPDVVKPILPDKYLILSIDEIDKNNRKITLNNYG